jgi:hypothetical protein
MLESVDPHIKAADEFGVVTSLCPAVTPVHAEN